MKKYIKYTNDNHEFFYSKEIDDYEKLYLIKYGEQIKNSAIYNVKFTKDLNIIIADNIFITHVYPEDYQLRLFDTIGVFFPHKDENGIYGECRYINNQFITKEVFYDSLNCVKLEPIGLSIIFDGEIESYRLYGVYFNIF